VNGGLNGCFLYELPRPNGCPGGLWGNDDHRITSAIKLYPIKLVYYPHLKNLPLRASALFETLVGVLR